MVVGVAAALDLFGIHDRILIVGDESLYAATAVVRNKRRSALAGLDFIVLDESHGHVFVANAAWRARKRMASRRVGEARDRSSVGVLGLW